MPQEPMRERAASFNSSSTVGRGRRVLVVDDDSLNRKLMELRLRDAGFVVETADTAETALRTALETVPDAILSDIQMPGMDGVQLRRAIRNDLRLARIPMILVSSALVDERARRGSADIDGNCVVRSPDLHEAIEALAAALGDPPTK